MKYKSLAKVLLLLFLLLLYILKHAVSVINMLTFFEKAIKKEIEIFTKFL